MNFVAHALVAAAILGEPDAVLGAVVPDLAGRTTVRLLPQEGLVGRGVANHRATDAAFHDHAWFLAQTTRLAGVLRSAGVGRGPARGAAHVGLELLIDGELLAQHDHSAFLGVWGRLTHPDATVRGLVAADDKERWLTYLAGFTGAVDPWRYADAGYTARRVDGVLSRRPRLRFEPGDRDLVEGALRGMGTEVRSAAPALLADVTAAVRAAVGPP